MKKLSISAFGISLLLHLAIFLTVGGWVLIQAVAPKLTPVAAADTGAPTPLEPPPDLPDDAPEPAAFDATDPADSAAPTTTGAVTDLIAAAPVNHPAAMPAVYLPAAAMTNSAAPATTSARADASLAKKITIGNLFGATIESGQLGVIIDVSGSGHTYLPAVIDEIEKNFTTAYIVLVFGCGMADHVTEAQVQILDFAKAKIDPERDAANARSIHHQLILAQKNPAVAKLLKRLKARPNVWYLYGGDTGPTQFAFALLLKKGVDTIYWFSDFEDQVNKTWEQKIPRDVKARKVKLIAHNFSGSARGEGLPFARALAEATGGKLILATPKVK
ncbi:MAG: hypothetical protein LBK60_04455 [Verrucomicrobiales bacterium]|jgi:hypothetical protein|nr:hypothetical protein [Verrucomicrobiales bacterium]